MRWLALVGAVSAALLAAGPAEAHGDRGGFGQGYGYGYGYGGHGYRSPYPPGHRAGPGAVIIAPGLRLEFGDRPYHPPPAVIVKPRIRPPAFGYHPPPPRPGWHGRSTHYGWGDPWRGQRGRPW